MINSQTYLSIYTLLTFCYDVEIVKKQRIDGHLGIIIIMSSIIMYKSIGKVIKEDVDQSEYNWLIFLKATMDNKNLFIWLGELGLQQLWHLQQL